MNDAASASTVLPPKLSSDPFASFIPENALGFAATLDVGLPPEAAPAPSAELSVWSVDSKTYVLPTGAVPSPPGDAPDAPGPHGAAPAAPMFRLVRQLGQGGMGEVWEAVQASLGRVVAVKRIRADRTIGSAGERRRQETEFRQEATIAARLEHPNIIPVHDLGRDPFGNTLLAMKLVRGEPWDKMLAEDLPALSIDDVLALHLPILIDVSQAVAFAHSRGIVHRDLKPAQVMVGRFGEVLLMDWGLAVYMGEMGEGDARGTSAAVELPVALPSRETAANPAGTPALMAPEQTHETAAAVGPWTDIYLLGGTLYCLLTGTYPHHAKTAHEAFFMAAEGKVEEPSRRAPSRDIPAELGELAMRALARDPRDRPKSAEEFVRGLQDYLTGSTRRRESAALTKGLGTELEAARGSYVAFSECLDKLARARNLWPGNPDCKPLRERALGDYARAALVAGDLRLARVQAERMNDVVVRARLMRDIVAREAAAAHHAKQRRRAVAASIVSLIVLVVAGVVFSLRLNEALATTATALDRTMAARERGDKVLGFLLSDLSKNLASLGRLDLMDGIADHALEYFATQPLADLDEREMAMVEEGLVRVAEVSQLQGNLARASRAIDGAIAAAREMLRRDPTDATWRRHLSAQHNRMGGVRQALGDHEGAQRAYAEAKEIREALVANMPDDVNSLYDLSYSHIRTGGLHQSQGRIDLALAEFKQAETIRRDLLAIDPEHRTLRRELCVALGRVGEMLQAGGDLQGALAKYTEARTLAVALVAEEPDNAEWLSDLSIAENNLGRALEARGDLEGALTHFRAFGDIRQRLTDRDPTNLFWLRELSVARAAVGRVLQSRGDLTRARDEIAAAMKIRQTLVEREPENTRWRWDLCVMHNILGGVYEARGERGAAIDEYEAGRDHLVGLLALDPDNAEWRLGLAVAHLRLGVAHRGGRDRDAALEALGEARAVVQSLLAGDAAQVGWQKMLANIRFQLADLLLDEGSAAEALVEAEAAAAINADLSRREPSNAGWRRDHALCLVAVGRAHRAIANEDSAAKAFEASLTLLAGLVDLAPSNGAWLRDERLTAAFLAESLNRLGRAEEAVSRLKPALDRLRTSPDAEARDVPRGNEAIDRLLRSAMSAHALSGRKREALEFARRLARRGYADLRSLENDRALHDLRTDDPEAWDDIIAQVRKNAGAAPR